MLLFITFKLLAIVLQIFFPESAILFDGQNELAYSNNRAQSSSGKFIWSTYSMFKNKEIWKILLQSAFILLTVLISK